jgi:hypothetical protein
VYVQSRVPAELVDPGHRSSYFGFPLIEGKKSHEIKTRATHTRGVQSCQLVVRNAVVNNADAAIASGIIKAFERIQQQAVIAAVNRAMDDDAAVEADRLVHLLGLRKGRAFNRRIWRIGSRRKLRRFLVDVKLAVAASGWRLRNRHARMSVPFVNSFYGCCHFDYFPDLALSFRTVEP